MRYDPDRAGWYREPRRKADFWQRWRPAIWLLIIAACAGFWIGLLQSAVELLRD